MRTAMAEIEQLMKMANQIAANFSFHHDGVGRLADHLQRFWAPSMIRQFTTTPPVAMQV